MTSQAQSLDQIEQLDFTVSSEQEQLRDMARRFLEDHSPEAAVREVMFSDGGYDQEVWQKLAAETGLVGLLIPEEYGGSGLAMADMQIVLEEMGRALFCGPYLSTAVMAVSTLLASGDEVAKAKLLPQIAEGRMLMTLAIDETDADPRDFSKLSTTAEKSDDGYRLNGSKETVTDGAIADGLLVLARADDGASLFHVNGEALGLTREDLPTFDLARRLARVSFSDTPATLIGGDTNGAEIIERSMDLIAAAMAAEQLGGAQFCLDLAVDYAKTRQQFGRSIGSFQAIKHKCADLLLQVEAARSAVQYAGLCAGEETDDLSFAASMAKAYCSEAFTLAAGETLQIHGGIGFTWEHTCHLYLKRAKSSELMFGDALFHRQRLATQLEI